MNFSDLLLKNTEKASFDIDAEIDSFANSTLASVFDR